MTSRTSSDSQRMSVYRGNVRHRRFTTPIRQFAYGLYMCYIDLDRVDELDDIGIRTDKKFARLAFHRPDYLGDAKVDLKTSVNQFLQQRGQEPADKVFALVQLRCFGYYFSPINLYYCYRDDECQVMIAEVSNTPWGESCYYLIDDIADPEPAEKIMHVSPFQPRDMHYHWVIKEPGKELFLHIENHREGKAFDATMRMLRRDLTKENLQRELIRFPWITLQIITTIYWQALKLIMKKARFYANDKPPQGNNNVSS